ncbi:hypothetical protein E2P60_02670 [Candidatus Bathyarchaeota archaeon]|nr:hypothetical protein E2P60_02670 [Candidatus Bathyarchaeota archaeon]
MTVILGINASKLIAIVAVITFIIGAVAVFYSINLFFRSSSPIEKPAVLRVSEWSGYILTSDMQSPSPVISYVSASWMVPEVKPSENMTFSGVWIGIGGYGEESLIQAGTEQEYLNNKPVYYAWYELLPDYLVRIPTLHVQPGDTIAASINLVNENTNTWLITIEDVTRSEQFKKTIVYTSSMLSAEWVVERPTVNGTVSTLADFGNVTFTECKATVDDVTGPIGNFSYAQLAMYDEETPLVFVSPLNVDESGFTVSYLKISSPTASADDLTQNVLANCGFLFLVGTKTTFSKNAPRIADGNWDTSNL